MAGQTRAKVKSIPPLTAYAAVNALAVTVGADMLANIAVFPTPAPPLATLTTDNLALTNAITAWGPVGGRGSHSDLLALRAACLQVRADLRQLAAYVQNLIDYTTTYADQVAFINLSGFSAKNTPMPQGVLGAPVNLHQVFSNNVPINQVKLRWKKPIGLNSAGNVKSYQIWEQSPLSTPGGYSLKATTTNTVYIDQDPYSNAPIFYYVVAVNDQGQGAPSNIVAVHSPII